MVSSVKYINLNKSPFIPNGTIVPSDDQHNRNATAVLDGIVDYYTSTATPFSDPLALDNTVMFWIMTTSGGTKSVIMQHNFSDQTKRAFQVHITSNPDLLFEFASGGTGLIRTQSTINMGHKNWDDGNWHFMGATFKKSTNSLDIYIDGVVATEYAVYSNPGSSGHFNGFPASPATLSIGQNEVAVAGRYFPGSVARPDFREGTHLSAAQMLAANNLEVSKFGEGFRGMGDGIFPDDLLPNALLPSRIFPN